MQPADKIFQAKLPDGEEEITKPTCMQKLGSYLTRAYHHCFFNVINRSKYSKRNKETFFKDKNFSELWIKTPDNIRLHCGIRRAENAKYALLLLVGLGNQFEEMADSNSYAYGVLQFANKKLSDWTFMAINYRGRNHSGGHYIPKYFHYDAFSAMQYLILREGFKPDNVLAIGHSMGGYAVIQGAALLQKIFYDSPISAVIDRGVCSFPHLVEVRFGKGCKGRCIRRTVNQLGWDIKCAEAAPKLKGKIVAIVSRKDLTIPYQTVFGRANHSGNMHVEDMRFRDEHIMDDIHPEGFTENEHDKLYELIQNHFISPRDRTKTR